MVEPEMFYKIQVKLWNRDKRWRKENKIFKDFIEVSRQEGRKDAELVYTFPERLSYWPKSDMKAKQTACNAMEVNLPV